MNLGSRSQVKSYVRQGLVTVNGALAKSPDRQVDELSDKIAFRGEPLCYKKFVYYMMNKPVGVVSATSDRAEHTVVSLLGKDAKEGIFPVGRLDKDTTGLLLLTDDGGLAHRLLAPRRHVDKTYLAVLAHSLGQPEIRRLEAGVDIGEERPTLPARVELLTEDDGRKEDKAIRENKVLLTLHEGKFHQVKRMLQAVDNQVTALKRIRFGKIILDEGLAPGAYRPLTTQEEKELYES